MNEIKKPMVWGDLRHHRNKPTDEKIDILMKCIKENGEYCMDKGMDE